MALVAALLPVLASEPPAPTIAQTALLALAPPTGPAPAADASDRSVLRAQLGGVSFPNYRSHPAARATGQRTDLSGGRTTRTVYYTLPGSSRISYSIVSGPPLKTPAAITVSTVSGVRIQSYAVEGLSAVMLLRRGHTCVLAGVVPSRTLIALAAAPLRTSTPA